MLHPTFAKVFMAAALALAVPAVAQEETPGGEMPPMPGEVIAGDLLFPRGVAFDADGTLYIAEAGNGGDIFVADSEDSGQVTAGLTGRITTVAPDGTVSPLPMFFPSGLSGEGGTGLYRAYPQGDSLWVVMNSLSLGPVGSIPFSDVIAEIDRTTGLVKTYIDLGAFEAANDPDGAGFDSNASDVAWGADGTLYISDAGGNDVLTWTADGGLQVFQAYPDNPVPTAVEVAADGSIYIGFLGAGIAPAAGKIEHWSADGELIETFDGLTAVTDIALGADGTLYAVQFYSQAGEQGPDPMTGNVISVSADGATPVVEGLYTPFGVAVSPEGNLVVSAASIQFGPPTPGMVIEVPAA